MERSKKPNADKILLMAAVGCLLLPIVIFLFGWTRLPIALAGAALLLFFAHQVVQDVGPAGTVSIGKRKGFWLLALAVLAVWVGFSGQGGFAFQNGDWDARNATFRDLCRHAWPVCYDFSDLLPTAREALMSVNGDLKPGALCYYVCWWLPVAALVKLLGCSFETGQLLLYVWTLLCVFLAFYCLVRCLGRYSYAMLAVFMLFSGWDVVMNLLQHQKTPFGEPMEWWARYFQYSGMTTQLYWVFNQAVPVWLIVGMLLLLRGKKNSAALCALAFAYSPFATIGLVPIALAAVLENRPKPDTLQNRIKAALSVQNFAVPLLMLLVFGSYYLQNDVKLKNTGFLFQLHPEKETFLALVVFLAAEALVYFLTMGRRAARYRFYWVTLAELLLLPLYAMGEFNDFCMRASIPALLLLMVMTVRALEDVSLPAWRRAAVAVCLCLGFLNSGNEIYRNVRNTVTLPRAERINDDMYSIGDPHIESEPIIRQHMEQYVAFGYEDTFFYRYLARH